MPFFFWATYIKTCNKKINCFRGILWAMGILRWIVISLVAMFQMQGNVIYKSWFFCLFCCRSNRSQMFSKIGVLKNLVIFIGKHLCWSLFLIKCNFLKIWFQHSCFPVNIVKFLRTVFFYRIPPVAASVVYFLYQSTSRNNFIEI